MKKLLFTICLSTLFSFHFFGQKKFVPSQPLEGPGSAIYAHGEVKQYDFAQEPEGFWLFEPACPRPDSANVVVFTHGYGGYNPMIYGMWIRHLVRKGNIVIYPRYQKNVYSPMPTKFSTNVSQAIRDALGIMKNKNYVQPITRDFAMVGHSYGGVISADLAVNFKKHNIPKPVAIMLCSPGSGPLRGGLLDTYNDLPDDLKMIVMVSDNDQIVGDKFGKKVYETATNVRHRNFIRQYHDSSTYPSHRAGHNESYALDMAFDYGQRNATARRALKRGKINNIDYYGYWKIFDALLDCSRSGENCNYAFGNTPEQRSLGFNSDGTPLRELEVLVPIIEEQPSASSQ